MKKILATLAAAGFLGSAAAVSEAAPITYNSKTAFTNAVKAAPTIALLTDKLDFSSDAGPLSKITRSKFTVQTSASILIQNWYSAFCSGGAKPTTGCITVGALPTSGVTFTFGTARKAFGLIVTKSVLASVGSLKLTIKSGTTSKGTFTVTPVFGANGAETAIKAAFIGVIDRSSTFTSVTIKPPQAGISFGFDNVQFGP